MEGFAIILWIMGGMVASPVICKIVLKSIKPNPIFSKLFLYPSILGLIIFLIDLILVGTLGVPRSNEIVGFLFFTIHSFVTLFSAAFFAIFLLLGPFKLESHWWIVAIFSWLIGVFAILYQYHVAEELFGIDGIR